MKKFTPVSPLNKVLQIMLNRLVQLLRDNDVETVYFLLICNRITFHRIFTMISDITVIVFINHCSDMNKVQF